jgi:hypothetical protein
MRSVYDELFDLANRPSAGVDHWRAAVETQLRRVRASTHVVRLANWPGDVEGERPDDEEARERLHFDIHFLVLAIRNVVRFHLAVARKIGPDERLNAAHAEFLRLAPEVQTVRNVYEHLEEHLVGGGRDPRLNGVRASPVIVLNWRLDRIVVSVAGLEVEVVAAARAAVDLATATAQAWDSAITEARERLRTERPDAEDGPRMLQVSLAVSIVIEGDEGEDPEVSIGGLRDVLVRPQHPDEAEPSGA